MTVEEVEPVAQTLARAFLDDPHFRWIVRHDAKRLARMERGFATFIARIWLPQDAGYVHERLIGAALWMPPDTWHQSPLAQLRLLPAIVAGARGDTPRLLRATTWMEKRHPRARHWYLPAIGIAPAWQGRGYGAALLAPMLERCDAERVPAYLEASTPRNRALYERHGFEVVEEGRYADDAPPLWRMWREPN
jgi:GNAT superfamily N-acetyltransferase